MADDERPKPNMSADVMSRRIGAVINELLAETGGGILNGFMIFADYYNDAGEPCWAWSAMEGQRVSQTVGYANICKRYADFQVEDLLNGE